MLGRLFSVVVVATLTASTSASAQSPKVPAEHPAKSKTAIEAAKLPPVRLSPQQIGKLWGGSIGFNRKVVWHAAGRQSDGNIFVCFVQKSTTVLGQEVLGLYLGTFESDGEYHNAMHVANYTRRIAECHKHGMFPPVQVRQCINC